MGNLSLLFRRWPKIKWDKIGPYILIVGVLLTFINLTRLLTALDKLHGSCHSTITNNKKLNKTFAVHGKRVSIQNFIQI